MLGEFQTEKLKSVHLKLSKKIPENWKNNEIINKWIILKRLRKLVNSAIENVRNQKVIGSSLEAEVYLYLGDKKIQQAFKNIDLKKSFLFLVSFHLAV